MDYVKQFFRAYRGRDRFSLMLMAVAHEGRCARLRRAVRRWSMPERPSGSGVRVRVMDEDLVSFLSHIATEYPSTAVVIVGDHGAHALACRKPSPLTARLPQVWATASTQRRWRESWSTSCRCAAVQAQTRACGHERCAAGAHRRST